MPVEHVVLIVADGVRPDAIDQAHTPNLDRLRARGSSSWQARTVRPTATMICHASLFHSVPPDIHGVTGESFPNPRPVQPSIVDLVTAAEKRAALIYSWRPLTQLAPGEHSNLLHHYQTWLDATDDAQVARTAAQVIRARQPVFSFVYWQEPDVVGHAEHWMSDAYLRSVERIDHTLGLLLDDLSGAPINDSTAIVFLADHGGIEDDHQTDVPEVLTIPLIVAGPGIHANHTISSPVSIMDTAPTIAHLLGLPAPTEWQGQPILEILDP